MIHHALPPRPLALLLAVYGWGMIVGAGSVLAVLLVARRWREP